MMDEIEVIGPARMYDPERDGLMQLFKLCSKLDRPTVERCWNRVREDRNHQALARMRQGDSMAGIPHWLESWPDSDHDWEKTKRYFAMHRIS
jgi:hypothetical protein